MKKFYYLLAGIGVMLVTIIACEKSSIGVDELQTLQNEEVSAKGAKVDICHWDAEYGVWVPISISENALEAHRKHGDKYDWDGDGYSPENECGIGESLGYDDCELELDFVQDFETNTDGWIEYDGPITSNSGNAIFENGAFTRFDGYRNTWQGTWTAEIDIYLDPSWTTSQGFEYSVAASGSDGAHRRDYIFHVSKDSSTGLLLVAGSNNSNFAPREDLENMNHFEVTTSGWYTFQHVFSDIGGQLSVDLNLLDSDGNVLFTETRTNASDLIPTVVGGNRYGWFTFINVTGGIEVDNTILTHCE